MTVLSLYSHAPVDNMYTSVDCVFIISGNGVSKVSCQAVTQTNVHKLWVKPTEWTTIKFDSKLNHIHWSTFENAVFKMLAIVLRAQYVNKVQQELLTSG